MKRSAPISLSAHVAELWDAAKMICPDQESCRRHPRLNRALIEFEKHLPFDDNGEVLIERPASPVPLSELAIPLPQSVVDLLAAARALLDNEAGARERLQAAVDHLDEVLIEATDERFYLPVIDGEGG
jgi:hypothetical protein